MANNRSEPDFPPLDMRWADVPTERGRLPRIGPLGLLLADIEKGAYGVVPDYWPLDNDTPRGAYLPPNTANLAAGYSIHLKSEVWADNAADLYEQAIHDRWISATDIPWEALQPLPQRLESAIDQLCTNWSEWAHLGLEAVSKWLEQISYGFHEVKLFLSTVCFDYARHTEAFRKRALANGGGLGVQTPGALNRSIYSAMKFTELTAILFLLRTSMQVTLWESFGPSITRTDTDRRILQYATRDLKRHLEYGIEHLKYFVQAEPDKRYLVHGWLNRGEHTLASDWRRGKPFNEALMLLLDDDPRKAKSKLREVWRAQIDGYSAVLQEARLRDHVIVESLTSLEEQP